MGVYLTLTPLSGLYAVCRLAPAAPLPAWVQQGDFISITRTVHELSIVCLQDRVPPDIRCERDWQVLAVRGPFDFELTGILASVATPLAAAGVALFALSTFDTDYILIQKGHMPKAIAALVEAGHFVTDPDI